MRVIAYYLPQFHEVKENNIWWGKGFTEWTNVKKAVPLFNNHYQPHVPLNKNYYDLMDKNTVIWQTQLAEKYGVYGFAYYHYWFTGRKILEKPAENLLRWKEIRQKYFFFWANHNWIMSVDGKQEFLLEQTYGGREDWRSHFEYFLPFFKDDRYIKVGNMPVVGIYMLNNIPDSAEMIDYWSNMAVEAGFSGIYMIESMNAISEMETAEKSASHAVVLRQPNLGMKPLEKWYGRVRERPWLQRCISRYYPFKLKYGKVIDSFIQMSREIKMNKKVYYGTYTGWDNTSRHQRRGSVHTDINPVEFKKSLEAIERLCKKDDFVFINAWNEWAEGMHLEPDEKNGDAFLAIIKAFNKD